MRSVSPGGTATDLFPKEFGSRTKDYPWLRPKDVSSAIMYVISTPPHVQIHELTIKPIGELKIVYCLEHSLVVFTVFLQ